MRRVDRDRETWSDRRDQNELLPPPWISIWRSRRGRDFLASREYTLEEGE